MTAFDRWSGHVRGTRLIDVRFRASCELRASPALDGYRRATSLTLRALHDCRGLMMLLTEGRGTPGARLTAVPSPYAGCTYLATQALLPSGSAITTYEGSLSCTTTPPAASAAAMRWSATS